jgi:pyruvate dehydrogenase E1 component beta subunit
LIASVTKTGRAIVVHEASSSGGIGGEVGQCLMQSCFYHLKAPVLRVTGYDTPYPPSRNENKYLPDADRILDAVEESMSY